jgi:hypothetical protein
MQLIEELEALHKQLGEPETSEDQSRHVTEELMSGPLMN